MDRADVAIVGAGYAGLAAATQLTGKKVLVLERNPSVMQRQRASLGLLLPLGAAASVRGDDLYLKDLELLVEGGVKARLDRLLLKGVREQLELSAPLVLLDESRLKGALLRRALERGAKVVTNQAVRQIATEDRHLRLRTDEEHQARVMIGADGAQSQVAAALGLRREARAVLYAREVRLASLDLETGTLLVQWGGHGRLFLAMCEREGARALVIEVRRLRETPSDLQALLEDWLERHGGARLLSSLPALVPLVGPGAECCRPQVLLAGDASAAWSMATVGGALAAGALAGKVAERLLAGSGYALSDYRREWRKLSGQQTTSWLGRIIFWSARQEPARVDRLLRSLRRQDGRPVSLLGLLFRLPALAWNALT